MLQRLQDDRRDFLRRVLLVAQGDRDLLAHFPLDRSDRPLGREHILVARRLADQQVPLGIQTDDRRQDRVAVLLEDDGPAIADDRHLAVGRSQVNADDRLRAHVVIPRSVSSRGGPLPILSVSVSTSMSSPSISVRRVPSPYFGPIAGFARPRDRLNFREADHAAPPGITTPQFLDHGPGLDRVVVDDFDHSHQFGIDRLALAGDLFDLLGCHDPAQPFLNQAISFEETSRTVMAHRAVTPDASRTS